MDRGEEEENEAERREADGGKGRMSPEKDGGEKREMGQRETVGEEMKGIEIRHPQTERDAVLEEERRGRGESIEAGRKRELEVGTGLERRIGIETEREIKEERGKGMEEETVIMKEIGTETERGIEIVKEIEKERGPVLHHHHHHQLGKIGATVLPLLVH